MENAYHSPWSLDDNYRVLIATNRFDEAGDAAFLLKRMEGRQVQLPGNRDFWFDKTHVAWHRARGFNCGNGDSALTGFHWAASYAHGSRDFRTGDDMSFAFIDRSAMLPQEV